MATDMETATWVIAGASVVNVLVLAVYAGFTWGIWRETRRTAERTELLARQARDAFRLNILVAYQEEIRSARELPQKPVVGIRLMERAFHKAFPEEWPEILRILDAAVEEWDKQTGGKG